MQFIAQGKTSWKFLSILIVLVIIVGGGAFWFAKNYNPTQSEINIVSEIANWKTYSDTEHSFMFKYPRDFQYMVDNRYGVYTVSFFDNGRQISLDFAIDSSRNYTQESIKEFLDQLDSAWIKSGASPSINREEKLIDGHDAIEYQQVIGGNVPGNLISTIFKQGNSMWSLDMLPGDFNKTGLTQSEIDIYRKIVSTFKFID